MYGEMPSWYALTKAINILWLIDFLLFIVITAVLQESAVRKRLSYAFLDFSFTASVDSVACHKDHIVPAPDHRRKRPVRLSHESAGSVSFHRIADLAARHKRGPCDIQSVLSVQDHRKPAAFGLALLVYPGKVPLIALCKFAAISHPDTVPIKQLNCKRFSASRSSSLEHLAAVSCGHSLTESVFLKSLSLLRLICPLHFILLFCLYIIVSNLFVCPLNSMGT